MTKRHGRGDVETRELKSASGTSNVSFCVFQQGLCVKCVSLINCLFVYQSQSPLNGSYRHHLRPCFVLYPCWSFGCECTRSLWCLFGSGAAVSSRGSCLSIVITRTRMLPPCTPRGVCPCLRSLWFLSRGAEARRWFGLRLNLSSRSLWVRALCCSYLPLRGLMLLALLWMNWVLAIPIFTYEKHTAF